MHSSYSKRRRSTLIVPLSSEKFIQKAPACGADAILLDLEDGVAASMKQAARDKLPQAVAALSQHVAKLLVRVNRPARLLFQDLDAAIIAGVHGIVLPKMEEVGFIRFVSELIGEWEAERGLAHGSVGLTATIETAVGLQNMEQLAKADPRMECISLGGLDLAYDCGFEPAPQHLKYPLQRLVLAARAAGIQPVGYLGSIAQYKDLAAFEALAIETKQLGIDGISAIHPHQIAIINQVFARSVQEIGEAKELLAAAERALAQGVGAFEYQGRMVDLPEIAAARKILESAPSAVSA